MAYERLNLKKDDLLDEAVFKRIDDAIEALDGALDAKEVEKIVYSTNLFNKNTMPFVKGIYASNDLPSSLQFKYDTNQAGGGWLNIPVQSGKKYIMSVNNPVVLTDFDNSTYGVFTNIWFVDDSGKLITHVPFSGGSNYYYMCGGSTSASALATLAETNYSTSKVTCKAYDEGNNSYRGMRTTTIQIEIIAEEISYMHVQVGAVSFGNYQINSSFSKTRGHLTEDEVSQLQNSFQINEGDSLLEYEEGGTETVITEIESNLTKLQSAFTSKDFPSSNLLNPAYVINHKYMNYSLQSTNGTLRLSNYNNSALLSIPIGIGTYVLQSSEVTINNKTFGFLGECVFTDENDKYINGNYAFDNATKTTYDPEIATVSGGGTTCLKITIMDPSVKKVYIPLLDSDKNSAGLWTNHTPNTGLTDEQLYNLIYGMQLNIGKKALPWEAYDNITTKSLILPENIEGLDAFQSNMETKINEALDKATAKSANMSCFIEDNKIYIRCKQWTESKDFVWEVSKVNNSGGNKYFNIDKANTCSSSLEDDSVPSLTSWKSCGDDICPLLINRTYIAANHGFNCVDKITATAHGKTEVDIGSIWTDSNNKTYVLTHIYNENTLGFVMYNSTSMSNGKMDYGNPAIGTSMVHSSGATNINDIIIENRTATQLWQCFNNYSIKLLVDGVEQNIETNGVIIGDRVEILTQYDVIYIPAMLNYLKENVGNNTIDSQHSDDITDSYLTMYINYQFNMNGSVSTYSSFYINKDISVSYIGLVQSNGISSSPYTYVPDTTFDTVTYQGATTKHTFSESCWNSEEKAPYRFYQFADESLDKGMLLTYDRSIGWGENTKRLAHMTDGAGNYNSGTKMYPAFISGGTLSTGTYFDGMAARVPLYKYDSDLTSVGWYWCSDDIILMIDTHTAVNKDIVLPDYMNNMWVEKLDVTDSVTLEQTYMFNNKLRFQCADYGYAVLRLYK